MKFLVTGATGFIGQRVVCQLVKKNIPVVVCGPGAVTAPHQIDEFIDIFEIKEAIRIYIASIINYLGIKQ